MAINNAIERRSLSSVGSVFMVPGVTPGSSALRFVAGWSYTNVTTVVRFFSKRMLSKKHEFPLDIRPSFLPEKL